VSLSVCLSAPILWDSLYALLWSIFTRFSTSVVCGRGSVPLRRRCITLCTSGFVDDVTFSHSGPYGGVTLARQPRIAILCAARADTSAA